MSQQVAKRSSLTCAGCQNSFRSKDPEAKLCPRCQKPKKPGTSNETATSTVKEEKKTANLDVQALVNNLVWQHGTNLAQRGDYPDLLAKVGLKANQVTKKILAKASKAFDQRVEEEKNQPKPRNENQLLWQLEPDTEDLETGTAHNWLSQCGRYRIARIDSVARDGIEYCAYYRVKGRWDHCEHDKQGAGYAKTVRSLESALLMAEKFHAAKYKLELVESNLHEVLSKAEELGLVAQLVYRNGSSTKGDRLARAPRGGDVDRFGSRLGSNHALINAQLTTTPTKMKDLVTKAQLTGTYYNHLNALVNEGKIKKNGEGYFCVGE